MSRTHLAATICLLVLGLLLLPTVVGAPAKTPALARLLPASNELQGWAAMPNTLLYCANAKELHKIYDGGDGEYMNAGVTEAVQGTYKSGGVIAIVTIHKFGAGWQKSKAFYAQRQAGITKSRGYATVPVKNAGCCAQAAGGQLLGYSWTGHYMVQYDFTKPDTTSAMQAFMKSVTGKCSAALAPK